MAKHAFIWVGLSNVKVNMMVMRVPVLELLCQAATGWIPVLKYLLSCAPERLWSCHVVSCIKYRRFPRFWLWWCLPDTESPGCDYREPEYVLRRGMRQTRLTGGETLSAHDF
jgi:hypothetical protein